MAVSPSVGIWETGAFPSLWARGAAARSEIPCDYSLSVASVSIRFMQQSQDMHVHTTSLLTFYNTYVNIDSVLKRSEKLCTNILLLPD
jgi:hypothetical protein